MALVDVDVDAAKRLNGGGTAPVSLGQALDAIDVGNGRMQSFAPHCHPFTTDERKPSTGWGARRRIGAVT